MFLRGFKMSAIAKARINNFLDTTVYYCQVSKFLLQWAFLIAVTLLVFGGAVWFGSLAWHQKHGGVFFVMGFCAWLAMWRFFVPPAWFTAKSVLGQFISFFRAKYL